MASPGRSHYCRSLGKSHSGCWREAWYVLQHRQPPSASKLLLTSGVRSPRGNVLCVSNECIAIVLQLEASGPDTPPCCVGAPHHSISAVPDCGRIGPTAAQQHQHGQHTMHIGDHSVLVAVHDIIDDVWLVLAQRGICVQGPPTPDHCSVAYGRMCCFL